MTHLKEGDQAPAFKGLDQDGNEISLANYDGKKLIIFFYPKDGTPTCTNEACNLRDNIGALKKAGFEVVGVSSDSQRKHQNFIKKHELPFPLIADTDLAVHNAFGVWGPKKFMGKEYDGTHRTTFVVNDGKVERVFAKVKSKEHSEQILASYE
ncbi:MAG: thioredoxin-dependent thiol peroxidase [Bacteroidota bacterium]